MEGTPRKVLSEAYTIEVTSWNVHHGSYFIELSPCTLRHGTYHLAAPRGPYTSEVA